MNFKSLLLIILCSGWLCLSPVAGDQLTLMVSGQVQELVGNILIEAEDGSLYFQENTGKIWFVQPDQIRRRVDEEEDTPPISKKKLGEKLLQELPEGFRIYETKHYVVAYQNELAFARWVVGLYESRLYRGFENFWRRKKVKLTKQEFPLVTIIFGSRAQYQQFVDRELGPGQTMIAYYNLQTNRVAMFDLTAENRPPGQRFDERRIDQVLQNPAAVQMVATLIHEATHQLMFNRGVQTRFADTPLWLNEGLAMFFEAPDLNSQRGWQKPGLVFYQRLNRFRAFLPKRPADSLETLITTDDRLRGEATALDAYAEAWAFNHFLLNRKSEEYAEYLTFMASKKPLEVDEPATRLADFQKFLGEDLQALDAEFLKYVARLR